MVEAVDISVQGEVNRDASFLVGVSVVAICGRCHSFGGGLVVVVYLEEVVVGRYKCRAFVVEVMVG